MAANDGAEAVAAMCAAVAEMRSLRKQMDALDNDGDGNGASDEIKDFQKTMFPKALKKELEEKARGKKAELAAALKRAISAKVNTHVLLEATAVQPGDSVEIYGLESESGKKLNGQQGAVEEYVVDRGRFQVKLESGTFVSVRPSQLRRLKTAESDEDEEAPRVLCTERSPELGDVVRWTDEADAAADEDWVLERSEDAVVVKVDEDGDFKLRNPAGIVSPRFRFRKCFHYTGKKVDVPVPCMDREPVLGDVVRWAEDADAAPDGEWSLEKDEDGIIVKLDEDNDFKLKNPRAMVTPNWLFRKDFAFTGRKVFVPVPCTERMPNVGDVVRWAAHAEANDDEDWSLGQEEDAVVFRIDEDGDFKLTNAKGLLSPHFQFRKSFAYMNKTVFVPPPCSDRMPVLGDVVRWSPDAEVVTDGDWSLALDEDAVVIRLDEDGDFKLRNALNAVSPHFQFRKHFTFMERKVAVPRPCAERLPEIKELVRWAEDAEPEDDGDWSLGKEEEATVMAVDEDGDFRLQNPAGIITPRFRYRTSFVYCLTEPPPDKDGHALKLGDRVEISGLSSEAGQKLNGKVGSLVEFDRDKERYKIKLKKQEVSVKPCSLSFREPKKDNSSSSSSSSEAGGKKRQRSSAFGGGGFDNFGTHKAPKKKKSKHLTPEEKLEMLLGKTDAMFGPSTKQKTPEYEESPDNAARQAGAHAAAAAAAAAAASADPIGVGDRVEVFGLKSAAGKSMNGKQGMVTKWVHESGRFQVELGMPKVQSIRPENLRRLAGQCSGAANLDSTYTGVTAGYTLL